ncbi:MAG: hypothetical protein WCP73_08200, partial [Eubacteriales bacterium]
MDSRERVLAAVAKNEPDRLPVFCGRIDDLDYWLQSFGMQDEAELRESWGLDCQKNKYNDIFYTQSGKTIWGAEDNWEAGFSSMKKYPLSSAEDAADVEKYVWPDIGKVNFNEVSKRILQLDPCK